MSRHLQASATTPTANNILHTGIFLSTLGNVRGGLESIAAGFARELAQRGHVVKLVSGAVPGQPLPKDLANLGPRWLRAPMLPFSALAGSGASTRSQARRLKLQSLSFVATCRIHPGVRRLLNKADVTMSFLEIETVALSYWRSARKLPHVSYFPGVIDRQRLVKDRSHLRLAISRALAEETGWVPIDGVVTPGIDESWLREPYSVRGQAERLFFAGRLQANKGVWELIQIFAAMVHVQPALRLRVAGDGPLRRALEARVIDANLTEHITFLGAIAPHEIQAELRAADLFLFPTHYESFGLAVLEAQAIGVPVVVSDLPVMQEVAGDAAYLLPLRDVDGWVKGVLPLLDDFEGRVALSGAGRQNAARYTWARAASALEGHLLALTRKQRP